MNHENYTSQSDSSSKPAEPRYPENSGKVLGGLVLLVVGGVLLARQVGVELPEWLFTWPMMIIAIGIFIGAKSKFRDWSWLITVTVGAVFLMGFLTDNLSFRNLWPLIVIVVGLNMILNSSRNGKKGCV